MDKTLHCKKRRHFCTVFWLVLLCGNGLYNVPLLVNPIGTKPLEHAHQIRSRATKVSLKNCVATFNRTCCSYSKVKDFVNKTGDNLLCPNIQPSVFAVVCCLKWKSSIKELSATVLVFLLSSRINQ